MTNILVFGDSIAYGDWDKEGGWVDRLKRFFINKTVTGGDFNNSISIFNLSISGDTTKDILKRLPKETSTRIYGNTLFIFAVGINDSIILKTGESKTSKTDFGNNLEKLYDCTEKYPGEIIFVGLTPVDESRVTPMPWSPEESYYNKSIDEYNQIIKKFCGENKLHFINILSEFKKHNYLELLEDGVHPNTQGHELIFETVKNFLYEKII